MTELCCFVWNVKLISREYAKGLQYAVYKYLKCVRYFTQEDVIKKEMCINEAI